MLVRSRSVRTLMVVALVGLAASACEPEVTKEVLFVNDSVTSQSIPAIVQSMNAVAESTPAGRYAPNFGSSVPGIGLRQVPGSSMAARDYWTAHMTSLVEHVRPEVIVVELGYNDCGRDLSTYGEDVDNFMAAVPVDTPVHWLTMHDVNNLRTCDQTFNEALSEATTRWANLSIFDFAAHMEGHPEWAPDGTHLNAAGQAAYAEWLHDQLDAEYFEEEEPPPPPEPT